MVPIDEFARRQGMSKRKVNRYVKLGQVCTQKIEGKTFVVDSPLIQQVTPSENVQQTQDSPAENVQSKSAPETAQMTRMHWMHLGFMQAQAKSKTRWQNYAFVVTILFAAALMASFWLYLDNHFLNQNQQKLFMDKYASIKQLHLANARADELSLQLEVLRDQYNQLAIENAALKAKSSPSFSNVQVGPSKATKSIMTARPSQPKLLNQQQETTTLYAQIANPITTKIPQDNTPIEKERQNSILNGNYPKDMTRDDLLATLGQPDRIYKSKVYEQWLYFDHSPGRFWFKNAPYAECTE